MDGPRRTPPRHGGLPLHRRFPHRLAAPVYRTQRRYQPAKPDAQPEQPAKRDAVAADRRFRAGPVPELRSAVVPGRKPEQRPDQGDCRSGNPEHSHLRRHQSRTPSRQTVLHQTPVRSRRVGRDAERGTGFQADGRRPAGGSGPALFRAHLAGPGPLPAGFLPAPDGPAQPAYVSDPDGFAGLLHEFVLSLGADLERQHPPLLARPVCRWRPDGFTGDPAHREPVPVHGSPLYLCHQDGYFPAPVWEGEGHRRLFCRRRDDCPPEHSRPRASFAPEHHHELQHLPGTV